MNSEITINRDHTLGIDEAKRRVDKLADKLGGRLKLTACWEGNRLQVVGQGVSGHIDVDDVSVRIHVSMGFTMMMFRESIRSAIEGSIDEYID